MFVQHIYLLVCLNLLNLAACLLASDSEHKQQDRSRAASPAASHGSSDTSAGSGFRGHSISSDPAFYGHRKHGSNSSANLSINSFLALGLPTGAGSGVGAQEQELLSDSPGSSLTSRRSSSPGRLPVYDPATHKLTLLTHATYDPKEHKLVPIIKHHTKRPVRFGGLVHDFSHEQNTDYVTRSEADIARSNNSARRHDRYGSVASSVLPSLAKPNRNGELADEIAIVGRSIAGFDRHDARQTSVLGYILGLERVQAIPVLDKAVREQQAGSLAFRAWPGEERRLVGPVVTSARRLCGIGASLAGNGLFQTGACVALAATIKTYLNKKS